MTHILGLWVNVIDNQWKDNMTDDTWYMHIPEGLFVKWYKHTITIL